MSIRNWVMKLDVSIAKTVQPGELGGAENAAASMKRFLYGRLIFSRVIGLKKNSEEVDHDNMSNQPYREARHSA